MKLNFNEGFYRLCQIVSILLSVYYFIEHLFSFREIPYSLIISILIFISVYVFYFSTMWVLQGFNSNTFKYSGFRKFVFDSILKFKQHNFMEILFLSLILFVISVVGSVYFCKQMSELKELQKKYYSNIDYWEHKYNAEKSNTDYCLKMLKNENIVLYKHAALITGRKTEE